MWAFVWVKSNLEISLIELFPGASALIKPEIGIHAASHRLCAPQILATGPRHAPDDAAARPKETQKSDQHLRAVHRQEHLPWPLQGGVRLLPEIVIAQPIRHDFYLFLMISVLHEAFYVILKLLNRSQQQKQQKQIFRCVFNFRIIDPRGHEQAAATSRKSISRDNESQKLLPCESLKRDDREINCPLSASKSKSAISIKSHEISSSNKWPAII
jgi:hypothetical protein